MLKYLILDVGADTVARDNDGLTTLHAATQGGHLDIVRVSDCIILLLCGRGWNMLCQPFINSMVALLLAITDS